MKIFYQPPSTPEGERFFSRYAALIPNLTVAGYLGQVVSALTEWGILYALLFTSLAPLWPEYAAKAAITGATVGVTIIEVGLRRLLPFAARAVILKQWKGYDGGISAVVVGATVLLLSASATLSFTGSRSLVTAVATPPTLASSEVSDDRARRQEAATSSAWKQDEGDVVQSYAARIEAARTSAAGAARRVQGRIEQYRAKERVSRQPHTTIIAGLERQEADILGARDEKIATLTEARETELTKVRERYREKLEAIETDNTSTRAGIAQANEATLVDHQLTVSRHGGGLAWFTLVCLTLLVVSIVVKELHHAGAGVEERVQPDAFTFEQGPLLLLYKALTVRVRREVYSWVNWVERTTLEAPEPVQSPVLWRRETPWRVKVSRVAAAEMEEEKLAPDQLKYEPSVKTTPATPPPRLDVDVLDQESRPSRELDALENASTHLPKAEVYPKEVAADEASTNDLSSGYDALTHRSPEGQEMEDPIECENCGETYDRRRPWQRFCTTNCRRDYHAKKHNGVQYIPGTGGRQLESEAM